MARKLVDYKLSWRIIVYRPTTDVTIITCQNQAKSWQKETAKIA